MRAYPSLLFVAIITASTGIVVCSQCLAAPKPKGTDGDQPPFVGEWTLVYEEAKGRPIPVAKDEKAVVTFSADKFVLERDGDKRSAAIKWATKEKVYLIDFQLSGKQTNYGILRVKDDTLELCVSNTFRPNTEADRPIDFSADPEKNNNLRGLIYQRFIKRK